MSSVFKTTDAGILSAAREIVQAHTPDEIARIVETADPLVARAIKAIVARHGLARLTPPPARKKPVFWPGRRQ